MGHSEEKVKPFLFSDMTIPVKNLMASTEKNYDSYYVSLVKWEDKRSIHKNQLNFCILAMKNLKLNNGSYQSIKC